MNSDSPDVRHLCAPNVRASPPRRFTHVQDCRGAEPARCLQTAGGSGYCSWDVEKPRTGQDCMRRDETENTISDRSARISIRVGMSPKVG